ncbi:MAG: hypothetical protein L3J89_08825 [Gammaproteobacteria bacterium]|nr:hypothetical protein [Gammaproteobacteria bacterium]
MNTRVKLIALLGCIFTSNQSLAVPNYSVDQNPMPGAKVTMTYNHNSGGWGITSYYGYYVTEFPSLNDFGFIAGRTDVANSPHPLIKGPTSSQAAVWENGVTKNITFFNSCRDIDDDDDGVADASACGSRALAINNLGYVGGSSNTNKLAVDNYFERSRAWWPGNTGEYDVPIIDRPLSAYTPSQSQIEDINHQSNVVGTGITPGGAGPQDGLAHGLVSIDGDQDYIGIKYQESRAHALNENNLVTGAILWNDIDDYLSNEPSSLKAYTWLNGKLNVVQDDITDSSYVSEGFDVNDSNLVVGLMGWRNNTRAFKWDSPNGSLEDLGTLGGNQSVARSVNNAGTIVGWASTSDGAKHAFVYENGTMYDLNDYASGDSGLVIVDAYSINEVGQILVRASNPSGSQNQYWLLTDPDAESFALPEPRPAVVEAVSMGVFGGENDEIPVKIMADAEGNTISIGYFNAKYHTRLASTIDFDASPGEDIQNTSSGLYIQKLDANGNYLWTKTLPASLGISSRTEVTDLFVEPDGSFHIVGWVNQKGNIDINPDLNAQEFLIKSYWDNYVSFRASYSSHGYLISSVRLPQFYRMPAVSIAVDSDKNIYVAYVKNKYSYDLDFDPGTGVAKVQLEQGRSAIVITKTSRDSSGIERLEWAKSMSSIGVYNEQTEEYEDNYARIKDVSVAAPAIAGEGPMLAFTYKGALNFQVYDSNLGLLGNSQIVNTDGVFRSGFIRMSESEYPGVLWMAPEAKKSSGQTKVKLVRSGDYFGLQLNPYRKRVSQLFHGIAANAGISHISRILKGESKGIGINQQGDIYISGYAYNPINFDPDGYDLQDRRSSYVTKINADGSYGWTFSHNGRGYTSVAVDRFENITLTGITRPSPRAPELFDHNGNVLPYNGGYDAVITRLSPITGSTTGTPSINPTDIISTEVTLSQAVIAGEIATYTVTATSLGDTTEQVNLSFDSLGAGITAIFADTSLTPPVGGSVTTTFAVTADANVTDDSYPIRILVADEADQLYNNIVVTLKILRPDLKISISPSVQRIDPGDSTTYDLVFTSIDRFSSTLDISAIAPHASIAMNMSPAQVVLQPNGTAVATLTVNTDIATPTKLYYLKITATDGQYTQRVDAQLYFRDTDLVVTEISTPDSQAYAGARIDLKLTARNGGDFYARPKVSIYLSRDATITTEDIRVSWINLRLYGGTAYTWEPYRGIYIPLNLTDGTYYLGAIIDPENQIVESNENNNVLMVSTALEIKAKGIDLFINSVSIQDSQAYTGSRIWVEYTIGNQGDTPVSARRFSMGAYLSRDATITTEDRRVGNLFKYDLEGNESQDRGNWINIPSNMDSGIYYLGIIIDDRNQQEESNEDNNIGVASTTLQIGL